MPQAKDIGQGIVDLIRDHLSEHAEYPAGFEGLTESKHDSGLLVFSFEDGSTYRAIIDKVWDPAPVIEPTTTESEPAVILDEQEELI